MKKAILSMNGILWMFLLIFVGTSVVGQVPTISLTEECTCLDNEDANNSGQFTSTITVKDTATMQEWLILSIVNVYDATASNPLIAMDTIPADTSFVTSIIDSSFSFQFVHIDNVPFSFVLIDTIRNISFTIPNDLNYDFSQCRYPRLEIAGSLYSCVDGLYSYCVEDYPSSTGFTWSLGAMDTTGAIIGGNNSTCVVIQWDDLLADSTNVGPYKLYVESTSSHGCTEVDSIEVSLANSQAMACNKLINVSIGANCMYEVEPDDILEGFQYPSDAYDIILWDLNQDTIIPGLILDGNYIGIPIKVMVVQACSGISCWGEINLEDKFIPNLLCSASDTLECDEDRRPILTDGLPLLFDSLTMEIFPNGDSCWQITGFDLCGPAQLCYSDSVDVLDCGEMFSSKILRKWTIEDVSGRMNMCIDTLYLRKPSLDSIVFPSSFKERFGTALHCEDKGMTWVEDSLKYSRYPSPESTGYPTGISTACGNFRIYYTDTEYQRCGPSTFMIGRRWTIDDLCSNNDSTHTQIIEVIDTLAPELECPKTLTYHTGEYSNCKANIKRLVPPLIVNECSGYSYTVKYKNLLQDEEYQMENVVDNHDGTFGLINIPLDTSWVIFVVTDSCGNESTCTTDIVIVDNNPPVAVCDKYTTIGLNSDGVAWADAWAFDDGSHAYCSPNIRLYVRRMEDLPLCDVIQNEWTDQLKFCCEDVGKTIMVALKVENSQGDTSICMVEAEVQDNNPPVIIECPKDKNISCGAWYEGIDLDKFGLPIYQSVCGREIRDKVIVNINDCGIGTVTRIFYGVDENGFEKNCTLRIHVGHSDLLNYDKILWPLDTIIVDGCLGGNTLPDSLALNQRRPRFIQSDCSNVNMTYEDVNFYNVEGYCVKILRKWKVVDWCQFDQYNPTKGSWFASQVIKVRNQVKPVIECSSLVLEGTPVGDCEVEATLKAYAWDDCDLSELSWSFDIDYHSDGRIDYAGLGNDASGLFPYGNHIVHWTVIDKCGNTDECNQSISIIDKKAPTPYCIEELVTVIMVTDEVSIWAKDFGLKSIDNCTEVNNLNYSFSNDIFDKQRTFTCEDLQDQRQDTFMLDVYVTDAAGNYAYCSVEIIIQDNQNYCNTEPLFVDVIGNVFREDFEMIENVELEIKKEDSIQPQQTDLEGKYAFISLDMYGDYKITAKKNSDVLLGLSTLDIILIQRHILGLKNFESPYQIIAADINNSKTISTSDIVELRKLILGITNEFKGSPSWKFIDANQKFINKKYPYPYNEFVEYNRLDTDMNDVDFVGVKIGDVNNSAKLNANNVDGRSNGFVFFSIANASFVINDKVIVPIKVETEKLVNGFQITIEFDDTKLSYSGISSDELHFSEENINLLEIEEGKLSISWNDVKTSKQIENALFQLEFIAKEKGEIKDVIAISSKGLKAELYLNQGNDISAHIISLKYNDNNQKNEELVLLQNIPNPFTNSTEIEFILPTKSNVRFSVFDLTGRVLYEKDQLFGKGRNTIKMDNTMLSSFGVLYYQIEANNQIAIKKMIFIK